MKFKNKLYFFTILISFLLIMFSFSNVLAASKEKDFTSQASKTEINSKTKTASKKIDISEDFNYYISLSSYVFEYTGKEIKPKAVLYKINSDGTTTKLKQDTDFKVSYKNNIKISNSDATVTVTGIGNYTGSKSTCFTICKYDIAKAKISDIPDQEYNGKLIKPSPKKVTYNGKTLKEGTDYSIAYTLYSNSITPVGTSYITLIGSGDFGGTQSVSFKIIPKTVKNVNATLKTNGIEVSWDKLSNCDFDSYQIYRTTSTTKNLEYKLLATVDKNKSSYLDTTPATTGKTYYYKVCAYKVLYGTSYYSKDSNIKKKAFAQGVTFTLKSNTDSTYLKWDEINGADAYQIFRSTSKNGNYVKVKTEMGQKNCSWTDKTVEPYKTYYYKIRCYANTSSGKVFSKFTSAQAKSPLGKTTLKQTKYNGSKVTLKWSKVNSSSGYKIYRATSQNGKYKKIATVSSKKTSYTDKKISQGKAYYYKIRAFKKKNGKELYGQYSDIKVAVTGTRTQQINKVKLSPDKDFKTSSFNKYYKKYQKIINKVSNSKDSTYKKVKAMYKYLVQNLYHKDGYNCKNFAGTFAGMCRVLGLNAYCATGETKSGSGYTAHTWTVVEINGTEYIFDASLDRHAADKTKKSTSYNYFFKTYDELPGVYKCKGYENYWPFFMVYLK